VTEYARMYLGESKQVKDFTQQFLDRRSKLRNSVQKQKPEVGHFEVSPLINNSEEFIFAFVLSSELYYRIKNFFCCLNRLVVGKF